MVGILLAFGGFYNAMWERRFKEIESWLKDHDKRFDTINGRCMAEVGNVQIVATKLEALSSRLQRVENKLDWLIERNGHNAKVPARDS